MVGEDMGLSITLHSSALHTAYPVMVEVFVADGSGNPQGQTHISLLDMEFTEPTTIPIWALDAASAGISVGDYLVATATDANGNTSEFSPAILVEGTTPQTGPIYTVNTTADENDGLCGVDHCSLREAITAASYGEFTNTVMVPAGTYVLTLAGAAEDNNATGDLDIYGPVEIIGAGASTTIIDGNALGSVDIFI